MDNCNDFQNHEFNLHDINTLEWEELVSTVNDDSHMMRDGNDIMSIRKWILI